MIDYAEVLSDLEARQELLQTTINSIRALMELPNVSGGPSESAAPPVKRQYVRRQNVEEDKPLDAQPSKPMGIRDAIRKAVAESPRTATEIADRVTALIPAARRDSVSTQISQLITEGHLHKDDFLKVRFVNGREPVQLGDSRMNLPPLEDRVRRLLELTAEESRTCKACGVLIYFVRHRNGKLAPYTVDGLNHFLNCPQAARFKKGPDYASKAAQA